MKNKKTSFKERGLNIKLKKSRDIDMLAKDVQSWWSEKFVFIKKTEVRSLYGFIAIAFTIGLFASLILVVNFDAQTKTKAANTGTATLSWNANSETDLAGYKIYYGTTKRTGTCPLGGYASNIDAKKVTSYVIGNLTEGQTYYFSITAYNTAGKESCFSAEVSKAIPVTPVADTTAPVVSIVVPANNATISGTTDINATATDNVGVTKVEFYVDGALKSTDTMAPYAYALDTTKLSNAAHQLSAKAYDAANNIGTSSQISVTVKNAVTCTSFTYSDWSTCLSNNTQTRTVISSLPAGCTGGTPVLTQSCQYSQPTCTSFTYSAWGTCQSDNTQTRTVISSLPDGCTGGTPILSQSCQYSQLTCTRFLYNKWSTCVNGIQTRTVKKAFPALCVGGNPILTQTCK